MRPRTHLQILQFLHLVLTWDPRSGGALGRLGLEERSVGPFLGVSFWPLPEPRLIFWSSGKDAVVQPVPGHHGKVLWLSVIQG